MVSQQYREQVLDHYRNPRHAGPLDDADVEVDGTNTSCGDEVTYFLAVNDGKITAIGFTASGCAITQASASMLAEEVLQMPLAQAASLREDELFDLFDGVIAPMREDCARLPLQVLQDAIARYRERE